jgi:hypothetical protein
LLDKLTGKLPAELRGGYGQILPPISKETPIKKSGKSKGTMSVSSRSRAGDDKEPKNSIINDDKKAGASVNKG